MGIFSSLHLLSFIFYMGLILYILIKNPKPLVKRLIATFVACLAIWSFSLIYAHNPHSTEATAKFFVKFSSIGWLNLGAFFLWFSLVFAEQRAILAKKYFYPLLFALPVILIPMYWMGFLTDKYYRGPYGWNASWNTSIWTFLFFGCVVGYMFIGLVVLLKVMKRTQNPLKRKQAKIIFFSTLFSVMVTVISDIITPFVSLAASRGGGDLAGVLWASGIVYAMARHKFLFINSQSSVNNIQTTMFDCLILLNEKGHIISLNDPVLNLLGYKENELRGKPITFLMANGKNGLNQLLLEEISVSNNVRNRELFFRDKKGKTIPVTFSSSLLQDDDGRVDSIVCIARDLTSTKRNEAIREALFTISEAPRKVVTLREFLMVVQQQVNKLMDARNFYVALLQDRETATYAFPFIVDINPEELVDPDETIQLPQSYTHYVLCTEKPLLADTKKSKELTANEEIQLVGTKPLCWLGVPLKAAENEVIGVVVVQSYFDEFAYSESDVDVLSIISNTIANAIKYKQAEEALRESEEHYRTLIDNIQDGVILLSNRKIEFANDAFVRMLGYKVNDVVGKEFSFFISLEDREMVMDRYKRRLEGETIPAEYEYKLLHKNGSIVNVNMHIGLVTYKDGLASMGTVKDITERKRAEQKRLELEEKLARSEKMEAIGRLAGGVAHDLNNVLSGIVSYPDLLLMKLPSNSPYRKAIRTMQQSGQRAAAIVQDLLTLARRGVMVKKSINLNTIIFEYLESPEFRKLIQYHPMVCVRDQLDKDIPLIMGSGVHLSKTVMNLVSNAAEAMSEGGEIKISTSYKYFDEPLTGYYHTTEPGEYVVLTISDTGTGIASEDLDKIFDPFYTKKEMGRSGTGLGMSVVWGTVEDHRGFIDVYSVENEGTTFTLYFPASHKKTEPATDEIEIPLEAYKGDGQKILVVDDAPDQREIAASVLKELNYEVETAASGEQAIEYMKTNDAHLLLLDMLMEPGIDGLDTYKEILKIKPGMKAVIVSGFSESERVKEALKIGAGAYIKKPYTLKKIGISLSHQLDS